MSTERLRIGGQRLTEWEMDHPWLCRVLRSVKGRRRLRRLPVVAQLIDAVDILNYVLERGDK